MGNYHVADEKLLCKNHYQQTFAHKAPSTDGAAKSTTPRATPSPASTVDTKRQEDEKKRAEEAEKKRAEEEKKKQQSAVPAVKPATPVNTATPVNKPDNSKALESLQQFSAALDKLEHALTAIERRL